MVIKHTKNIWTFLDHLFTYLKFYVYFQCDRNQDKKSDFFLLFLRGRVPFHFFYTGNMNDFHFLPIWSFCRGGSHRYYKYFGVEKS